MRLILAAAMVVGFAGAARAQCPENVTCNDLVLRPQPNFDPCGSNGSVWDSELGACVYVAPAARNAPKEITHAE